MPPKLTQTILLAAIDGFESQKRKIDVQIAELRSMLDGNPTESADQTEVAAPRKRKKFSAEARNRMRAAQQRRWDKFRKEAEPVQVAATPPKPKPKRKLSAAAKAKLIANLAKARAAKAAKAKSGAGKKTATAKKAAPRKTTRRKAARTAAPATAQAAG